MSRRCLSGPLQKEASASPLLIGEKDIDRSPQFLEPILYNNHPMALLLNPIPETERLVEVFNDCGKLNVRQYARQCAMLITDMGFCSSVSFTLN